MRRRNWFDDMIVVRFELPSCACGCVMSLEQYTEPRFFTSTSAVGRILAAASIDQLNSAQSQETIGLRSQQTGRICHCASMHSLTGSIFGKSRRAR